MLQISSKFTIAVHLLALVNYLEGKQKVTSKVLSSSIGVNPVIVRNVMGLLKDAKIINSSQGKSGISLAKPLDQITFYDIYRAVDNPTHEPVFRFHDHPNPECPVGRNIHKGMDKKLDQVQNKMEAEMQAITVADVMNDIYHELDLQAQ